MLMATPRPAHGSGSRRSNQLDQRGKVDMPEKDAFDKKNATASVSESENPAIPSPTPKRTRPRSNRDWWPDQLQLSILRAHSPRSNPRGADFNYPKEFKTLDVEALKRDVIKVMTTSQ